jgi:DNA-binding NarL/FixJ family response regulator
MSVQTKVLVADAHALCREGLASLTREVLSNVRVIECADFAATLAVFDREPRISLALVDLQLPDLANVSLIAPMRMRFPQTKIVVTTVNLDRHVAPAALSAGIHGYVLKSSSRDELLFAIRSVFEGHLYFPSDLADKNGHDSNGIPQTATLSSRQFEILELLARGMGNKEIARRLDIAEGTVKVHLNAAFRALGVHNRAGAVSALHELIDRARVHQSTDT